MHSEAFEPNAPRVVLIITVGFSSCGNDENEPSLSKNTYSFELNFEGNINNYDKVFISVGTSHSGESVFH